MDERLRGLHAEVAPQLGGPSAHDREHALRVAEWTIRLAEEVPAHISIAAALCHDLVSLPKNSPERSEAATRSAAGARELLETHGFGIDEISVICDAIEDHSFSRGREPRSDLGRALQDADRLEALGAIGILRTAAVGAEMGAAFFDPADPFAHGRELDDKRFTVDHFYAKLFRLPEMMQTQAGREEASRRVEIMRQFLGALAAELAVDTEDAKK